MDQNDQKQDNNSDAKPAESLVPEEPKTESSPVVATAKPVETSVFTKQPSSTDGNTPAWAKDYQPAKPNANIAPKKSGGSTAATVISIIACIVAVCSTMVAMIAYQKLEEKSNEAPVANVDGYYNGNSVQFEETSIAGIAQKVTPAVVSIISTTKTSGYSSWFDYYYGGGNNVQQSAGTGMIVSSDGYIITNKHVVEGATSLEVITDAGDTYDDVKIVGIDPLNDVAYIKINGVKDLPTVELGDSKTIAVGQPVLAIGNALGAFQNSVTSGIISGTGRSIQAADSDGSNVETLADMIQTDAAINHGNSGGPLVNAAGQVIGINSAVSEDGNSVGFAIPISSVKGMLNNIMENGKNGRAYVGVAYVTITPEVAKNYDLSVKQGAYVHSTNNRQSAVVKGGPADKAGIKDGDIITKIGNVEVGTAGSVATLVGEYKSGDTITITVLRDGKEQTLKLTLEDYPE